MRRFRVASRSMARDTITPQQAASGPWLRALFGSRCGAARTVAPARGRQCARLHGASVSNYLQLGHAFADDRRIAVHRLTKDASMHGRNVAWAAMTVAGRRERMGARPATSAIRQRNV